jgi:serine/threonine protein kinase
LTDAKGIARFVRGIRTARTLCHPHLIAIYDAGVTRPHCWIAMEFVEGESVADMIKQLGPGGKVDWPRVLSVAVHVARALAFLHGHGVIHRNVLPANILVRKSDQIAKLGDAMLAKSLRESQKQEVTASGELVGNMYYMAPERTADKEVDGRADLYSLGASLYHMATGRLPFTANSIVELMAQIRQSQPEKPKKFQPALPDTLEEVILKLLSKRPEDRFASAGELLAALTPLTKTQATP